MKEAILTFIKAVFWGSLVGSSPFLLFSVPMAIAAALSDPVAIWIAIYPIAIAGVIVVSASVLFGLPLTAWLAHRREERAATYAIAGLGLGIMLPIVIVLGLEGSWGIALALAVLGAAAGATTAAIWGQWRERLASRSELPPESA